MSNDLRIYRFAPDAPGKGGHSVGFHTFLGRQDTRRVESFRPFQKMWRRDRCCSILNTNNYTPRTIYNFYEWLYYEAGGSLQKARTCFSDGYLNAGSNVVGMRLAGNQDIYWESGANPVGKTMFVGVKDRLVMGTRQGAARVWGGTLDVNGAGTNVWKLGCPAPTVAPTVVVDYNWTDIGTYYKLANSNYVCQPSLTPGANWTEIAAGETIQLYNTGTSLTETYTVEYQTTGETLGTDPGRGAFPVVVASWTGSVFVNGNSGNNTMSMNVPLPADGDNIARSFIGLSLLLSGNTYVITAATVSAGLTYLTLHTNLTSTYSNHSGWSLRGTRIMLTKNATAANTTYGSGTARLSRSVGGAGYGSWSGAEAPGYAYCYYDPVSGHVSNLSPITYVPNTDVVNGRVRIDITNNNTTTCANGNTPVSGITSSTGIQYVGEWASAEVARYTKILWFRTRRVGGGAVLYPIGSLDTGSAKFKGINGSPAYAVGYWTDDSTDADLLISGRIRAPIESNYPPSYVSVAGIRTTITPFGMAWWDGRLWVFGVPDPGALRFSCDEAQKTMGRAEECFPDANRLVIPASDGEITALLVCGEYLVVVTRRYAYRVLGNHESNYRLVRISTEIGGLTAEALHEIPTENGMGGMLAAVTADKRVLIVQIDGPTQEIGEPIVSELGGPVAGIAFYRADGHSRLAIGVGNASGSKVGCIYEYNFTHKTWTANNPTVDGALESFTGITYLGVILRNGVPLGAFLSDRESMLVLGASGNLVMYSTSVTTGSLDGMISTWAIPGSPTKRRYAFVWARAILIGPNVHSLANLPFFWCNRDGRSNDVRYAFKDETYAERRLFAGTTGLDGTEREIIVYAQEWDRWGGALVTNNGTAPWGYNLSFDFAPNGNDQQVYSVPFIEIAVREMSEDGEVDP